MIPAPPLPARPPEKVLLCSSSALRQLASRLPTDLRALGDLASVRIMIRQCLPDNFAALIDGELLTLDTDELDALLKTEALLNEATKKGGVG